jgi:hypothetical protein
MESHWLPVHRGNPTIHLLPQQRARLTKRSRFFCVKLFKLLVLYFRKSSISQSKLLLLAFLNFRSPLFVRMPLGIATFEAIFVFESIDQIASRTITHSQFWLMPRCLIITFFVRWESSVTPVQGNKLGRTCSKTLLP